MHTHTHHTRVHTCIHTQGHNKPASDRASEHFAPTNLRANPPDSHEKKICHSHETKICPRARERDTHRFHEPASAPASIHASEHPWKHPAGQGQPEPAIWRENRGAASLTPRLPCPAPAAAARGKQRYVRSVTVCNGSCGTRQVRRHSCMRAYIYCIYSFLEFVCCVLLSASKYHSRAGRRARAMGK